MSSRRRYSGLFRRFLSHKGSEVHFPALHYCSGSQVCRLDSKSPIAGTTLTSPQVQAALSLDSYSVGVSALWGFAVYRNY